MLHLLPRCSSLYVILVFLSGKESITKFLSDCPYLSFTLITCSILCAQLNLRYFVFLLYSDITLHLQILSSYILTFFSSFFCPFNQSLNGYNSQAVLEERPSANADASSRIPIVQTGRRHDEVSVCGEV